MNRTVAPRLAVVALLALALTGAACSKKSEPSASAEPASPSAPAEPTTIEVTARDYEFEGIPDTVVAGSTISLTTEEGGEPHEIIVLKVPEGETRSVDELAELPDAELSKIFKDDPVLVDIALPGMTDTPGPVVGDGTITDPGRYVFICTFPKGTTVKDVENAKGPLEGGTPHFSLGMRGEFIVE